MTRINLVHPSLLTDDHVKGEYKEITRVFSLVRARVNKGHTIKDINIPDRFCLNDGHVTFFYDKLEYIYFRYTELFDEMVARGYKPNTDLFYKIRDDAIKLPSEFWNWWTPKPEDYYISMARLCVMSKLPRVLDVLDEHLKPKGK